ncbi:MAG: T9SS type A sorting domain-containing protein [Saprospiraceae bacterium]|nr:T9SS type A sorting domain-containing protein [Saprospiraceae bacterium]
MKKISIICILVLNIHFNSYAQWHEKNIATNNLLTSVEFISENEGFVTGKNLIYTTINGGNTWQTCYEADNSIFFEDITSINKMVIIAVGFKSGTGRSIICKSVDGGKNWEMQTGPFYSYLNDVFFVTESIVFCAGSQGTILKSTDGGNNWQKMNSGTGLTLQSIFFVNDTIGVAVGGFPSSPVILKTIDGGLSWNPVTSPSNNYLQSVFFTNQETGYIAGWDGEILKTKDGGETWENQNSVSMSGNMEITFTNENTGYIVGGSMNQSLIQKTIDGGETWLDISPNISKGFLGVSFPSLNVGYVVGSAGTVVKTETGGTITSINNIVFTNEFDVFPNPTTGIVNIKVQNTELLTKVRVFDLSGRVIIESEPSPINTIVDLSNLETNIYIMEIISDKNREIKKILKH